MDVSDLGEFGLIARLRGALGAAADERLVVGIGDDAAAWRTDAGCTLATTDTMVAGVHFLADTNDWRAVGWKALASNVSDIAAMGGSPAFALVTLCLPPDTPLDHLDGLYAGIRECATAFGVTVVGGDIVTAPDISVTIALTGTAQLAADGAPALLRRDAARPGDAIAVSGTLGAAAGGLQALLDGRERTNATDRLITRHTRPEPRVALGQAVVAAGVRCGIDVSDGLVQDAGHVCEASGLGAELWLERLPIDADARDTYPAEAVVMAASGGEDYELLLVAPEQLLAAIAARSDVPLTIIGRMVPHRSAGVRLLDADGRDVALPAAGWDHLRRPGA